MPVKTSRTIAAQLNSAQVAISNTLTDPRIHKPMAEYGFSVARIKEGQKLYETARLSLNVHKALSGQQQYKTSEVNQITKNAYDVYQALAKIARAIWHKDKPRLEALGLHGKMPKTTDGFLTAAYVLFDNAAGPDVNLPTKGEGELADYGYTKAKLAAERLKIVALDKMNQAQEAAKGEAQNAARDQQAALNALNEWMSVFIKIAKVALRNKREYLEKIGVLARSGKTKAQRGAPKKAAETRARKKMK
ncbi:hypothetical protein HY768_00135 [candidate division TA06 bacterium]|uniref:Uncharacterized protein n=1 Tax=candidate division TA06 bacterium TaxID=2250710 RepID=A0A933MJS8_UNCT6|nr:hypothetical protein [candidate division TA06 bacterium]